MATTVESVTLRDVVAGNVARLRNQAGQPVTKVAQTAAALGLPWTQSWLSGVEQGTKPLSGEQLIALPIVLSQALGHRICLTDLLAGETPVTLGQSKDPIAASYLRDIITGDPYHRPFSPVAQDAASLLVASNAQVVEKMRQVRAANLGDIDVRTLGLAEAGAGAAETRLAQKLGVPTIVVIAAAASLWGRSLTDERDTQLTESGQSTTSAATLTRKLAAAITTRINEASTPTPDPTPAPDPAPE
jgi:hypothetical protein